jgi:hypothetical protein
LRRPRWSNSISIIQKEEPLARIERWLDRESYLFRNEQCWPKTVPGFFYQQLYNQSVEEEHPFTP